MQILFYRYGSICEPDLAEGFAEYGLTVSEITAEISNKKITPQECLALLSQSLDRGSYMFVFSVNFFPVIAEVCNVYRIPYLCLVVDSPVLELYSESVRRPFNRIFLFDKELYREFHPYNPDGVFHLPLATNVRRWDRVLSSGSSDRFASDLSFVGSLYTEKCPYDQLTDPPEYLTGYLNGLIEAQLKIYGYYFIEELLTEEMAEEFLSHIPDRYRFPENSRENNRALAAQFYIGPKITSEERIRIFKTLCKKYPVDIYTGSDTSAISGIRNRGRAKTLTEMPHIFHRSNINLNITARSIRSGLPLRIFDVTGCRGFLLTNFQTELADCFTVGEHLDVFDSVEDLTEKTAYYLEHPQIRKEMAQAAYEHTVRNHTWQIRVGQMITTAFASKEDRP